MRTGGDRLRKVKRQSPTVCLRAQIWAVAVVEAIYREARQDGGGLHGEKHFEFHIRRGPRTDGYCFSIIFSVDVIFCCKYGLLDSDMHVLLQCKPAHACIDNTHMQTRACMH